MSLCLAMPVTNVQRTDQAQGEKEKGEKVCQKSLLITNEWIKLFICNEDSFKKIV